MVANSVDITFICCIWNEIARAPKFYADLTHNLSKTSGLSWEILLIDNLSTDGTREWLKSLSDEPNTKIFLNDRNIGKGGSIVCGIKNSHGRIGIIYDLDGEYPFSDALSGYFHAVKSGATLMLSSRTVDGSKRYIYLQNYLGVKFLTFIINYLFSAKLTDTATGLKIFDLNYYKIQNFYFSGFNVDFEMVCIALKHKKLVSEFPGEYYPRSKKEGKKISAIFDGICSLYAIFHAYLRK